MSRIPVTLDCDPGHDDAVAILLAAASDALDFKALTIVAGNQTLPKVLRNGLRVLGLAGIRHVPVAAGRDAPLLRPLVTAPQAHGESGLDGAEIPETYLQPEPLHAIELLARVVRESPEPVTLIPTAPMTNIALFLHTHPDLKPKIREIVFMGGATSLGNVTPSAEFNAYVDPEALRMVLRSGLKITQIGLDVTHKALVNEKVRRRIREVGGPVATVVADLMEFYSHKSRSKHLDGSPLHDPIAVAQVIQPGIVTTKPCFVDVEVHGELTSGRTVVDFWGATGREPNVDVGVDVDVDAFFEMIVEALRTYR